MPRLPTAYLNVVFRESTTTGDGETAEDDGTDVDGLDGLTDHKICQLVVGQDAPPYNGMKSI